MHQSMRQLVGDDVDRQACEHHLAWKVRARIAFVSAVVAEKHSTPGWIEEGVPAFERVRDEDESTAAPPAEAPAEESFESLKHAHGDGIHDLLMRPGITFRWPEPSLCQDRGVI
jgi:hypothetical protein